MNNSQKGKVLFFGKKIDKRNHSDRPKENHLLKYLAYLVENECLNQSQYKLIVSALTPLLCAIDVSEEIILEVRAEYSDNVHSANEKRYFQEVASEESYYWETTQIKIADFDYFSADKLFYKKKAEVKKILLFKTLKKPETPELDVPAEMIKPRTWFLICLRMCRLQYEMNIRYRKYPTEEEKEIERILGLKPQK